MSYFPLKRRTSFSNEHIMAGVFIVTLLYMLPTRIHSPAEIFRFITVLATALLIDVSVNFIRFKRPVCAVSAGVTAGILNVLTPGVPLWGRLLGVAIALVGKHILGGTGKNIFNPALVGVFFISLFFKLDFPLWHTSLWLWPAVILSLPFLLMRPFAATGVMAGLSVSLLLHHHLTFTSFVIYGIAFWGCLVVTDPVTTIPFPLAGGMGGFLVGFLPLYFTNALSAFVLAFLLANFIWYALKTKRSMFRNICFGHPLKIKKIISFNKDKTGFIDLTSEKEIVSENVDEVLPGGEALERIQINEVFGYGGAGFPTAEKIKFVKEANVSERYFIINAAECDPGLIHDQWLIQNFFREIRLGIQAVCQCIPFKKVILAVKDWDSLQSYENVEIIKLPNIYPAGAEKVIISRVLHKELDSNLIPAKDGILVLNLQTVYAIYEAVYLKRRADSRYLTVANFKTKENWVVRVKLGEKVETVIRRLSLNSNIIFCGGGMMQSHLAEDGEVVGKATNFIAIADFPRYKESLLCSGCGLCMKYCPVKLKVAQIAQLVSSGKMEAVLSHHPEKCLNCGTCSYVCLAGRNLSLKIKEAAYFVKN